MRRTYPSRDTADEIVQQHLKERAEDKALGIQTYGHDGSYFILWS